MKALEVDTSKIFERFMEKVKERIGDKEYELALKKKKELGKGILAILDQLGLLSYEEQKKLFIEIGRELGVPTEDGSNLQISPEKGIKRGNYILLEDGSTYSYIPTPPSTEYAKSYVVTLPEYSSLISKAGIKVSSEGEEGLFAKILTKAVEMDVSDIHIRPKGDSYYIYFRWKQDFLLQKDLILSKSQGRKLVIWLKNYAHKHSKGMFNPDISSRVQDAKADFPSLGVSLRISLLPHPNMTDETVTIRILKLREGVLPLEKLGYLEDDLKVLKDVLQRRGGVVLFSGKTNSGKTTTISALLSSVKDRNILTVEDPIEYNIPNPNVVQHQIFETQMEEVKATFIDFARGFKRSDPDIVFVGEWRNDPELSKILEELSLAGQLVLTTIHLPSAFVIYDAIPSMYGVNKEVLIRSVLFSINQVLVDVPCPNCSQLMKGSSAIEILIKEGKLTEYAFKHLPYANSDKILEEIRGMEVRVKGKGCETCKGTGKIQITPIYEYLYPTEEFKEWIKKESPSPYTIEKKAIEEGLGKNKLTVFKEKLEKGQVAIDEIGKLR